MAKSSVFQVTGSDPTSLQSFVDELSAFATNAETSETNAANSASAAATSATNAGTSASSASTQASNAATSASNAATSETNAATSASNAATSETNAATSASNAATSETNAATSASNAATSETNAASSASSASTSATNAATSASAAQSAQTAAESARDSTLAAYDNFDDRYLGAKSSDPTVDNDGNALVAGSLYFDTTAGAMKVYTGSSWVAAYISGTGYAALTGATFTGNVTVPNLLTSGNVDGRDVSVDGTKLDGIEANADVTDTTNVVAALTAGTNVTIAADGTISSIDTDTTYSNATTSVAGLMSAADKTKLDGIEASADVTDTTNVVAALTAGTNITIAADGTISSTDTNTTYSNATTSVAGLMSATDKTKLDGVETGATADQTKADIDALGINAATLDSIDSSSFLRSDAADTKTSGALVFSDNVPLHFGDGSDLRLYHSGTASYIQDYGTGNLFIQANDLRLQDDVGGHYIQGNKGSDVKIYHPADGTVHLATTSSGISVTGDINATTVNLGANTAGVVQTVSRTGATTPNFQDYNSFVWTLTGNLTLNNPTTELSGMSGVFIFIHSGAGRTVSLGTDYETVGGAGLTLSSTAGAIDIVPYFVQAPGSVLLGTPQLAFA